MRSAVTLPRSSRLLFPDASSNECAIDPLIDLDGPQGQRGDPGYTDVPPLKRRNEAFKLIPSAVVRISSPGRDRSSRRLKTALGPVASVAATLRLRFRDL